MTAEARIRALRPSDHARVIAVIDQWWGGRPMAQMLATGYDGPGQDRVRFVRDLPS